jgi:hypothetical protein
MVESAKTTIVAISARACCASKSFAMPLSALNTQAVHGRQALARLGQGPGCGGGDAGGRFRLIGPGQPLEVRERLSQPGEVGRRRFGRDAEPFAVEQFLRGSELLLETGLARKKGLVMERDRIVRGRWVLGQQQRSAQLQRLFQRADIAARERRISGNGEIHHRPELANGFRRVSQGDEGGHRQQEDERGGQAHELRAQRQIRDRRNAGSGRARSVIHRGRFHGRGENEGLSPRIYPGV